MKKLFLLFLLLPLLARSQSRGFQFKGKPAVIGLELAQNLPPYIIPDQYRVRKTVIVEPSIGFNTRDRKWTMITVGYAQGYIDENQPKPLTTERFEGGYAKLSFETQHTDARFLRIAYGPQLSMYSINGAYTFEGPTFGDYTGHFQEFIFVPGAHVALIIDTAIGRKFRIRLSGQITTGIKLGENVKTLYTPGFGFTPGYGRLAGGINGGIHLFYNLR